jgi:succinyl-CoA synthetase beta subunit
MNFHEYQAKELFAAYGIPVPRGELATTADEAEAAGKVGGTLWVVKAQVHAGGRGKAGGVKLARSLDEVRSYAEAMLGMAMSHQPDRRTGCRSTSVLIVEGHRHRARAVPGMLVDRSQRSRVCMGRRPVAWISSRSPRTPRRRSFRGRR